MSAPIGGQAVLEGVMMRGPSNWSLAVRKPDGEIAQLNHEIDSVMKRHRFFRLPIIRGVIALGESLAIGFRALAISANYAAQEECDDEEVSTEIGRGALIFAFAVAIGFALVLFKVTPALITSWLPIDHTGQFVVFAVFGQPDWYWLILSRIALLPVIAGIAYELIRFAGKHTDNRFLMTLLAPGLWLQRLTTREPSLDQLEVSIRALKDVLQREGRLDPAERKVEVMA